MEVHNPIEEYITQDERAALPDPVGELRTVPPDEMYRTYRTPSAGRFNIIMFAPYLDTALAYQTRKIMTRCCAEHPMISIEKGIFGGIPHIKEMRLSVGDILGQLYLLGSVEAVVEAYAPDLTVDQVREAIAYAQDFLEIACEPHQTDG